MNAAVADMMIDREVVVHSRFLTLASSLTV